MTGVVFHYVENSISELDIKLFEKESGLEVPGDLAGFLIDNHCGSPDRFLFKTKNGIERIFANVLSYNKNDSFSVYSVIKSFPAEIIPFAMDPFGNYICLENKSGAIIFFHHEDETIEHVAYNMEEFLSILYDE